MKTNECFCKKCLEVFQTKRMARVAPAKEVYEGGAASMPVTGPLFKKVRRESDMGEKCH